MIWYEGDERAVTRVLSARGKGDVIEAGTARTIASWFNEPGIVASFVSTGAIPDNDAGALYAAMMRGVVLDDGTRVAAYALNTYLNDRSECGDSGPVAGWSDMWVPKHVDYPHESGALDTCWCYGESDDAAEDAESNAIYAGETYAEVRDAAIRNATPGYGVYFSF